MRALLLTSLLCILAFPLTLRAETQQNVGELLEDWHDAGRDRTIPIKIDYPKDLSSPAPVIILSHGLGGSREGLAYIGQYWAAHGYVAVHLQHVGSDESVWKGKPQDEARQGMRGATSLQQFLARVEDVKFALDELARRDADANWPLHGKLDLKQIAMAGHSFGAVTTQAMCGQIFKGGTQFFDPRIKAGVVFSPSPPKTGDAKEAFARMTLPMFYWTGTKDQVAPAISTVTPDQRRIPFDATTGNDRYLVILTDGNHMVFNGPPREAAEDQTQVTAWHNLICKGTTAFLDKYLKSDAAQAKYLDDGGFAKEAAALGTFEMKRADKE